MLLMFRLLILLALTGAAGTATAKEKPRKTAAKKAESADTSAAIRRDGNDVSAFLHVVPLGAGVGVGYALLPDTRVELAAGFELLVIFGYQYKFARVRQFFGNSFNVHAGGGNIGETLNFGATFGLGNEWAWRSGFTLGVDWLSATWLGYGFLPIALRMSLGWRF